MINKEELEKIKEEIEGFFEKMGFELETKISFKEGVLEVDLKSDEPQILIGEKGRVLNQIQRLLNVILKIKFDKKFYLDLDVNDYKKKKIQYLKEISRKIAEEVVLTKKEKILPPMTPSERRIIHLELAERKDVTTQSIGKEPNRRVVIKPYP